MRKIIAFAFITIDGVMQGKKLFNNDAIPATYELQESQVTPSGVIIANYHRAGQVETGTVS